MPLLKTYVDYAEGLFDHGICTRCAARVLKRDHAARRAEDQPEDAKLRIALKVQRELEDQITILTDALYLRREWKAPAAWQLSQSEERIMGVMVSRDQPTVDAFMAALYHDFGRDDVDPKIVDQFIYRIRKKVAPFGVSIKTDWGKGGYSLSKTQRDRIRAGAENLRRPA